MNNSNYYAVIPMNVLKDKKLSSNEKLLYAEITSLSKMNGKCFASNAYFAESFDSSKESIQRWLLNLENNKYIKRAVIYKKDTKIVESRHIYLCGDPHLRNDTTLTSEMTKVISNTTYSILKEPKGSIIQEETDVSNALSKKEVKKPFLTYEDFCIIYKGYNTNCRVIPDMQSISYKRTLKACIALNSVQELGNVVIGYVNYMKGNDPKYKKGYDAFMNSPEHYGKEWISEKKQSQGKQLPDYT